MVWSKDRGDVRAALRLVAPCGRCDPLRGSSLDTAAGSPLGPVEWWWGTTSDGVAVEVRIARRPDTLGLLIAERTAGLLDALRGATGVPVLLASGETDGGAAWLALDPAPMRALRPGPAWRPVVRWLLDTIAGLHGRGVVHGALDPTTVRLYRGRPVVDGWERVAARRLGVSAASGVTAPECARGAAPTAAADLYAVGCLAFFLVTGALPFDRPTAHRLCPPPCVVASPGVAVPSALDGWLRRMLAKDPARRFPDAARAAAALP